MRRFTPKTSADGRHLLNLACGTHLHSEWNNVDFSPYATLDRHRALAKCLRWMGLLSDHRWQTLQRIKGLVVRWDLAKGIPYENNLFDVVYHAHFLEHLPKEAAPAFLRECQRVLKPGGLIRIVVPDLFLIISRYWKAMSELSVCPSEAVQERDAAVDALIGQMVRMEVSGTMKQKPIVRLLERYVRGKADRSGELHRWMYDSSSLGRLLAETGFSRVRTHRAETSDIPFFDRFQLDVAPDGTHYHPHSLYMEAAKPEEARPRTC